MKLKTLSMLTLGLSFALAACSSQDTENQSVSEAVDFTIVGIEPGAGITRSATIALEEYENLAGWALQESSTTGMITELEQALNNEEPIIVTGWTPHWIFEDYDLKMLEEPLVTFGGAQEAHTITRQGFQEDHPDAYQILDNFYWEMDDIQSVMRDGLDIPFEEAAQNWIDDNPDKVAEWTDGVPEGNGEMLSLVSSPWDSERASAHLIKRVLEQHGFEVELTDVDPAVMFQALASSQSDFTVAPWLPVTQGALYEEYKDQIEDLGVNLEGPQNGLVVPAYVDIDSVEELEPRE